MIREMLTVPAATGLTKAITKMQEHLFAELLWLEKCYGLATDGFRVNQEQITLKLPEVYIGNGQYLEVLPNDKNVSQSFFYVDSAEQVVDGDAYLGWRMECNVSLVFWFDLDKIKAEMGYAHEHRFIDELKKDALTAVNLFPDFVPANIENRTTEVWKNWTIGRGVMYYGDFKEYAMTQIFKHPEAGFRLYGKILYEEEC